MQLSCDYLWRNVKVNLTACQLQFGIYLYCVFAADINYPIYVNMNDTVLNGYIEKIFEQSRWLSDPTNIENDVHLERFDRETYQSRSFYEVKYQNRIIPGDYSALLKLKNNRQCFVISKSDLDVSQKKVRIIPADLFLLPESRM